MKKLILVISKDPDAKNWNDCIKNKQNRCKLVVIDTQKDEHEADFRIITLEPYSPNRLNPELLHELLFENNQVYLLVRETDNSIIEPEININKNTGTEVKPMAQYYLLSERQRQIIHYLSHELTYKEIANTMEISYHTVKHQIEIIYFKWHVKNKKEATALYKEYAPGLN